MTHVPNNMTDQFHRLDLTVNSCAKQFLKRKFECWHAQQISKQLDDGSKFYDIQTPLKLSVIKPIHVKLLLELYDHFQNFPDYIIKGIKRAGIKDA